MAEVLSQQQIDDLLGSLQSGNTDIQKIEQASSEKKVKDYDFMSPKKFTREQLRLLDEIFDGFARQLSIYLSGILRMLSQSEVLEVEEEEFREFGNALSDSVLIAVMNLYNAGYSGEDRQILMEMSRPISFCILDRMLGGTGSGYKIDREYTEIELSLLEYFFKQISNLLKTSWSSYAGVECTFQNIQTSSQAVQFIQQDESAAIITIEIQLNDLKGNMNICLPATTLEDIFKVFDSKYVKINKKEDPELEKNRKDHILGSLKNTPLTVSATLGEAQISLKDLLEMREGDIIPLNSPVQGSPIVVKVEKLQWFRGSIGVKRKHYAVRIDEVLPK